MQEELGGADAKPCVSSADPFKTPQPACVLRLPEKLCSQGFFAFNHSSNGRDSVR